MADEQTENQTNQATAGNQGNQGIQGNQRQLVMQRIYIKDLSFESPRAPAIFTVNPQPETQLNMRSSTNDLGDDNVEVVLTLTVESKADDQTMFLVELSQAGIFLIKGFSSEEKGALITSYCSNALYAFAREAISDVVMKGGFPQLLLQPINFDALYAQAMREREQNLAEASPRQGAGESH